MSGYRDTSNYEPFGTTTYRPLRPYNWVQWIGVALVLVGLAIDLLYFAERLGSVSRVVGSPAVAVPVLLGGVSLINSRREQVADPAPELAAQRRRLLLITTAVCAPILGIAAIFALKGY